MGLIEDIYGIMLLGAPEECSVDDKAFGRAPPIVVNIIAK